MGIPENIKSLPAWMWKVFVSVGTVASVIWGMIQLWTGLQNIVHDSVKQSTINITAEIVKSEHNIGSFLIDDLRERKIVIEDEISQVMREEKPVPHHLIRKLRMMEERLEEGKEKWGD